MNQPTENLLVNRLKEVLTKGVWVTGTNFKDEISGLDWKVAVKKINGLNSIADITFHFKYYLKGVLEVLNGGELTIKDKFSFDYSPIKSETAWDNMVNDFVHTSEQFINAVNKMTADELSKPFVISKYGTYQRNLDVLIEHSYYHLGQIVLMKKWCYDFK